VFHKTTDAGAPASVTVHSLVKTAAVSLQKHGLAGQRAAVYLALDHSGSMQPFYASGAVQHLAEQTLALSVNLDDDGTVPVTYFQSWAEPPIDVRLDNHAGIVTSTHSKVRWGSTNYAAAIETITDEHRNSGATTPGLVIFQTDGEPDSRAAAEQALRNASGMPLFWAFVGFGGNIGFLDRLDNLAGRAVDNASFFHARDPHAVSDADLYDGITREFAGWITAATAAGIIR
jgi:hypothetical protein